MVNHLTKDTFHQFVDGSEKPVLVDFWAAWCGPCRMLAPIIEEIAEERDDVAVCKVDIDAEPELAQEFGVMSIPTVLVFKGGKLVNGSVGVRPKAELLGLL